MRRRVRWVLGLTIFAPAACITVIQSSDIALIEPDTVSAARVVSSPMKAFLLDGSTVVYMGGGRISPDTIFGPGVRYSLDLSDSTMVGAISLDSVAGIEAFQAKNKPRVWITDDERRIIVKLQTSAPVGPVALNLTDYEEGGPSPDGP